MPPPSGPALWIMRRDAWSATGGVTVGGAEDVAPPPAPASVESAQFNRFAPFELQFFTFIVSVLTAFLPVTPSNPANTPR